MSRGGVIVKKSKRPIETDDFINVHTVSDPQISPDGKSYIYVSTKINEKKEYESHLFHQQINESSSTQWTFGNTKNSHPRFSPDGNDITFQSTRTGTAQIYVLSIHGGEARQITTFKHGASNPSWSKDGSKIIFQAALAENANINDQEEFTDEEREQYQKEIENKPKVINQLKHKSDSGGFFSSKKTQIISYDFMSESFEQLTTANKDHNFEDISHDGEKILFSANLNEDSDYEWIQDIYLLHVKTNEIERITNGGGTYYNAAFSPSGKYIAYFGQEQTYKTATLTELYMYHVSKETHTCLSENVDIELGDAMISDMRIGLSEIGPVWTGNEQGIQLIGTDHGTTCLLHISLEAERTILYKDNNHVFTFTYNKETNNTILGISSPTHPGDFYVLNQRSERDRLTNCNATFLNDVFLQTPEAITVKRDRKSDVHGWIMKPYSFDPNKKYPLILEIHGGPHAMYGQTFFHELQLLASKGYTVLYMNPRGSHGYGQQFVNNVRSDYGGGDYEDLMDAVDYVLDEFPYIDKERLGVTGGSYGGFMTNWIIGHTNRFKAAVTQRCISNWLSFYGVSDIGYYFTKWEVGEDLLDDPKKLWDKSPIKYADNIKTPLLIMHGEQDLRCPIEQGEQLFTTLKYLRNEVEFIRFPHANHELSRSGDPTMREERLKHLCRWFQHYL